MSRAEPSRVRPWIWLAQLLLVSLVGTMPLHARAEVPEPLSVDLVRQLGPHRGELEANVVGQIDLSRHPHGVHWAPEVEWAPAKDFAIEVELPMLDQRLQAVKLSTQLTMHRWNAGRVADGVQVAATFGLDRHQGVQAVHVLAAELGRRGGLVTIIGPRLTLSPTHTPQLALLVNAALFVSLRNGLALGLETNWIREAHDGALTVLPQIHIPIGRHMRLQVGVGAHHRGVRGRPIPMAELRLIFER